jgi:hypothetical protein
MYLSYQVTWKLDLHIPASHPIVTPVQLNLISLHKLHRLLPHRGVVFANNITLLRLVTSPKVIPGTYRAHTKCTHFPQSVSLNIPPKTKFINSSYKKI